MTPAVPLNRIDVVELSDLAWTVIDPDGTHEAEEDRWTSALPRELPPPRSATELRRILAEEVVALSDAASPARLKLVATLMCFLAEHPLERPPDETLLHAAREAAGGHWSADVEKELAARAARLDAHVRARLAHHPYRHAPPAA